MEVGELIGEEIDFSFCGFALVLLAFAFHSGSHGDATQRRDVTLSGELDDAFDDVGGKLSFALALLDKENTGIILNAVHSRDNCYLYLKEIVKGESFVMLSQEEVNALRKAVNFALDEVE